MDSAINIFEGALVVTDPAAGRFNLKRDLLRQVKTMTVTLKRHEHCACEQTPAIRPAIDVFEVETIRLNFGPHAGPHRLCRNCLKLQGDYNAGSAWQVLLWSRPKKLVWARGPHILRIAEGLIPMTKGMTTLTAIVSPLSVVGYRLTKETGINRGHCPNLSHLRLIVTSWADQMAAMESPPARYSQNWWMSLLIEEDAMDNLHSAFRGYQHVEVYLVDPIPIAIVDDDTDDLISWVEFDHTCAAKQYGLYAAGLITTGDDLPPGPKVVFKSRKDYIQEGITDEIDSEELGRWKRDQDFVDRMADLDSHYEQELDGQHDHIQPLADHPDTISEPQLIEEVQIYQLILLDHWEQECAKTQAEAEETEERLVDILVIREICFEELRAPSSSVLGPEMVLAVQKAAQEILSIHERWRNLRGRRSSGIDHTLSPDFTEAAQMLTSFFQLDLWPAQNWKEPEMTTA